MRDDRFSISQEIIRELDIYDGNQEDAGPILFQDGCRLYMDTSSGHIKINGGTGYGKSYTIINYLRTILTSRESCLVIDPKGELYENTINHVTKHKVYCLDMRNPADSPDRISLLEFSLKLLRSSDVSDRDMGRSQIRNLTECVYPLNHNADPFWDIAARRFLGGIIYAMVEKNVDVEEFNLKSVARVLSEAEDQIGLKTNIQVFYDSLDTDGLAKRELSAFCRCPKETRGSIYGVCSNGFSDMFSVSEGLMSMLCSEPTIHLNEFDVETPYIFYIILPDEDRVYSRITGLIIQLFYQMLISKAQNEYQGCLPTRHNIIIEELGSIGVALSGLCNMVTAARSRGIRLTLCLQNDKQLEELYSAPQAKIINSCLSVSVNFSNSDWDVLNQWSQSVGERLRTIIDEDHIYTRTERIITPNQLRSMPIGKALIFVRNSLKFITSIPDYHDIFEVKKANYKRKIVTYVPEIPVFSISKEVQKIREKQLATILESSNNSKKSNDFSEIEITSIDSEELCRKIDERIKELEEEEKVEAEKEARKKKTESKGKKHRSKNEKEIEVIPEPIFSTITSDELQDDE